jgi:hypothetical protein
MPNPRINSAAAFMAIIALGVVGFRLWSSRRPAPGEIIESSRIPVPPVRSIPNGGGTTRFEAVRAALAAMTPPQSAGEKLDELRQYLSSLDPGSAVTAIRQFLDSRQDAFTGLGFAIGGKGFLTTAPSLRTFLLDQLAQLDPTAAAEYAKVVLASKDSPDEWALALRNLARGDRTAEGRMLLEQKTGEMLRYEGWQQNPSAAYLEAFDAAVYLGGTNLMPALSDLVRRQDNEALAHAAYLALDRLVINDPATTLATLQAAPEMMEGRELTRANYFARADVRDAQQRQTLEKYLLDPAHGPTEIDAFAGVYPNANFMISQTLLTQTSTPDHTALTARDGESLRALEDWLADSRFTKLRPQLEKAHMRLQEFVKQESGH